MFRKNLIFGDIYISTSLGFLILSPDFAHGRKKYPIPCQVWAAMMNHKEGAEAMKKW